MGGVHSPSLVCNKPPNTLQRYNVLQVQTFQYWLHTLNKQRLDNTASPGLNSQKKGCSTNWKLLSGLQSKQSRKHEHNGTLHSGPWSFKKTKDKKDVPHITCCKVTTKKTCSNKKKKLFLMPSTRFMYKRLKGDQSSSPNASYSNMTYKPLFFCKYAAQVLHPSWAFGSTSKHKDRPIPRESNYCNCSDAPAELLFSYNQMNEHENRSVASNRPRDRRSYNTRKVFLLIYKLNDLDHNWDAYLIIMKAK